MVEMILVLLYLIVPIVFQILLLLLCIPVWLIACAVDIGIRSYKKLTAPTPEKKLRKRTETGHKEIEAITRVYRKRVKEILGSS